MLIPVLQASILPYIPGRQVAAGAVALEEEGFMAADSEAALVAAVEEVFTAVEAAVVNRGINSI